jgi:hemolysin III
MSQIAQSGRVVTGPAGAVPRTKAQLSDDMSFRTDLPNEAAAIHPAQSVQAEIANSITHGLGLLFSLIAATLLLAAARGVGGWSYAAYVIYAVTMVAVYAASTASHIVWQPTAKYFLRMLDQGCIYLFIAGSFTPIAAVYLQGGLWWLLLTAIWVIATSGFIAKIFFSHRIDAASVAIPMVLGWLPVLGGPALLSAVPAAVVIWMLAGGLCYMAGTLFLMNDHCHPYLHALWHLWVIAGTACQFWAIWHFTLATA